MNAAQQKALNQRLNQHTEATEIILRRLDEIIADAHVRARRLELTDARLKKLESIVLPDPDRQGSGQPSQTPP